MEDKGEIQKNDEHRQENQIIAARVQQFFSGPLPPPAIFEKYELILPGSADRILKMAEENGRHRRELEKLVVASEQSRAVKGLWFGFIIGMTTIVSGFGLIFFNKEWQGFVFGLGGLVSLVGTFVYGKKKKEMNLTDKEKVLPG